LVLKVFGQINETCRLVRHLIIYGIKMLHTQNMRFANQPDHW